MRESSQATKEKQWLNLFMINTNKHFRSQKLINLNKKIGELDGLRKLIPQKNMAMKS